MTLLKKFRYFNTVVPSFLHSPYSCFLRYSLLERLFVIYNVSNLKHNLVTVSSSITLYSTSSARHSWIVLAAFRFISSQSSFDVLVGFTNLLCTVLWRSYCTNNAFTLFYHKPKFPLPLNFSISNFVVELFIFDILLFVNLLLWYQLLWKLICYDTNCFSQDRRLWNLTIWSILTKKIL